MPNSTRSGANRRDDRNRLLLSALIQMARYRFNLEDHHFIADRGSHECDDLVQASELADEIAERLAQDRPELVADDHFIVVRDEENKEVYRAPMDADSIRQRRRVH